MFNKEGISKQELNLVFVIDNSGSMEGEKIGAINNAIRDIMAIMPEIQEDTADVNIKISALKFSDDASWIENNPKDINEFKWKDLVADGVTNLSDAYDKLNNFFRKKRNGGMMPDFGGVAPIIILMTDGLPTSEDWPCHLLELKKKGWFNIALKYALAIGIEEDEAKDVLTKFTGNSEMVLDVYSAEALRRVIKVIAITASKVKSRSSMISNSEKNLDQNKIAKQEIDKALSKMEW